MSAERGNDRSNMSSDDEEHMFTVGRAPRGEHEFLGVPLVHGLGLFSCAVGLLD